MLFLLWNENWKSGFLVVCDHGHNNVNMYYSVEFETAICGYHIYKEKWTPGLGEKLSWVKDTGAEAAEYDPSVIIVYLRNKKRIQFSRTCVHKDESIAGSKQQQWS